MDDPDLRKRIDRGIAWVSAATATVAVGDVVALALILHYWLEVSEFGVVSAVVTVFPALTLIAELGLPASLVQGPEPDDDRLSTLFWIGLGAGLVAYLAVAGLAPWLARLQGHDDMAALFRTCGLLLVIRPLYTVHRALMRRQLRFKELSVVRVIANAVELVVKLGLAAAGYGVWCLVIAPLARELIYAIGVPLCARWRPRLRCRVRLAAQDARFGLRASASEILYQLYSNADYQVVAAAFGASALGLYRAAYELVIEPVRFVSEVVTIVAFPTFARLRNDRAAVAAQFLTFAKQNLMVVLTVVGLILVAAEDLLTVLIGAGYAPAATAARVLAVVGVLRALSHLGPPLLDGLGRPELTVRYQATAAVALISLYVGFAWLAGGLGFLSVALAWSLGYPLAVCVLAVQVSEQLRQPVTALLRALARPAALIVAATVLGGLARLALPATLGQGGRLAVTAVVVVGGSVALLILGGALSPRAVLRALRR
ncbi:MAG: oligosaccharide flippase family protein [Kofleriaceae bacterium]